MSGHSKWSTIKRKKGATDAKRGKVFSKIDATMRNGNILYTGTSPKKYKLLGNIIHFPMVEVSKLELPKKEIKKIINSLDDYHTIIFTSRFGVKFFFELIDECGYLISDLRSV